MVLTPATDSKLSADETHEYEKLKNELHDIDKRLRGIVDACEEMPNIVESGRLTPKDIELIVTSVYRAMRSHIYVDDSPLRSDRDIWDAFKEQKSEFILFYRCALRQLEIYKDILMAYGRMKDDFTPRRDDGALELLRRDAQALAEAREACIEAVGHFREKFSAMLTVL